MLECLLIGDSIAVGTAAARPDCVSHSRGSTPISATKYIIR